MFLLLNGKNRKVYIGVMHRFNYLLVVLNNSFKVVEKWEELEMEFIILD